MLLDFSKTIILQINSIKIRTITAYYMIISTFIGWRNVYKNACKNIFS